MLNALKAYLGFGLLLVLAGCSGEDVKPTSAAATASPPTISGQPATTATVGTAYSFTPTTTDPSGGTLSFTVTNAPSWTTLSSTTGTLSGTPTSSDVGTTSGIVITVSDGTSTASLAAFSITVAAATGTGTGSTSVAVVVSVAGGGTVTSTGGATSLNCTSSSGSCTTAFATSGASVALTAAASSGYTFTGWRSQGSAYAACGTATACSIAPTTSSVYLTAVFQNNSALNPAVLYTDIVSGPNTGGENNQGIYLTVFGKNFGSGTLGSTVKVYVNDVEVTRYVGTTPTTSRGRSDIQQIATQIGSLGLPAATAGTAASAALPVKVIVDGRISNVDQTTLPDPTFTVLPGNIYFVALTGTDTSSATSGGTFAAPWRSVQKPGITTSFSTQAPNASGAYGVVRAGDFIVMRGGDWTDVGFGGSGGTGYFLETLNKSGCPIGTLCAQGGGTTSGPITLMGYPGETAYIDRTNVSNGANNSGGGISSADSARQAGGYGSWWNIVNLKIESGYYDGPVNTQEAGQNPNGAHWRVVNNELTAASCNGTGMDCRAGGIAGSGDGNYWVGNNVHDIYDGPNDGTSALEMHGIYIGDQGSYEVAYNVFANIYGGNGFQIHSGDPVDGVNLHHNIIHDTGKHGINLADGSHANIVIWNNVVYNTGYAGIRFGGGVDLLVGLKLYNNTFYNTGTIGDTPSTGALTNDLAVEANQMDVRNNIFWPHTGSGYNRGAGNVNFTGGVGTFTNNLWYNAGSAPSFDTASVNADPAFVSAGSDFHLQSASPAIGAGTTAVSAVVVDDFDVATATRAQTLRSLYSAYDIGAYEH